MNPVPYYAGFRCAECTGFVRADGFVLPVTQPERGDPVAALCRECAMRWLAALRAWRIHRHYNDTETAVADTQTVAR